MAMIFFTDSEKKNHFTIFKVVLSCVYFNILALGLIIAITFRWSRDLFKSINIYCRVPLWAIK